MNALGQRRPPVPGKYQESSRLQVWYRHGYSQAARGFTPTENWLNCLRQDKAVSEAYYEGYRAGMLTK
ncbi:MAG TPA: hypothetical protein VHS28_05000 [Chloroflexota bacterium]|nr:hypothetical protein [Chloroflexota bacterium]